MTDTSKSRAVHARVDACALATLLSYYSEYGVPKSISQLVASVMEDAANEAEQTGVVNRITDLQEAHCILDEFVASGGRDRASQGIVKDTLGRIERGLGGEIK